MSEEKPEKRNAPIDRAASRKKVEPRKSRLEIAQERAAKIGIELPAFDPDQVVPELVGKAQHLAEAIAISVSKGNQQGAVFLKRILGANPGVSFTQEERQSIIDRHNWEARKKPKRPKLNRGKNQQSASKAQAGQSADASHVEDEPIGYAAKVETEVPASSASGAASSTEQLSEPFDVSPAKYGNDLAPDFGQNEPDLPEQPQFTWRRDGETLANNFFRSIYQSRPVEEIVAAANALNSDPEALAKVRQRGREETEYLAEAFRKLRVI